MEVTNKVLFPTLVPSMDPASITSALTAYSCPPSDEVALHYAFSMPILTPQGESSTLSTFLPAANKGMLVLGRNLL